MKITVIFTIQFMVLKAAICLGQSDRTNTNLIWGESVNGVQMSLAISNQTINYGSDWGLGVEIQNSSTNIIATFISGVPINDFTVLLLDDSGKEYRVKPNPPDQPTHINSFRPIASGTKKGFGIPVFNFDWRPFKPGKYKCEVKENFYIMVDEKVDRSTKKEVVSNVLDIEVKQP